LGLPVIADLSRVEKAAEWPSLQGLVRIETKRSYKATRKAERKKEESKEKDSMPPGTAHTSSNCSEFDMRPP